MRLSYLFYFALLPAAAHAYLDPGTGSLLVYALAGLATTAFFALRRLWYALRGGLAGRFLGGQAPSAPKGLPDVVLHSEGGRYWQVFKPVIDALAARGASCAYVSPDPADPGLAYRADGLAAYRPGGEAATIAYLNAASAAVLASSSPQLDVYMLRRSKGVRRYAHLFHAPTDLCFYEKYAFDYYDALLTVGPFMEPSVRALEARRGTPAKELLPVGCSYYDYMLEEAAAAGLACGFGSPAPRDSSGGAPTALYATAWGVRSSLAEDGAAIARGLAEAGFKLIVRPHPQLYVSQKDEIRAFERALAGIEGAELDRTRTPLAAMARADLMVADLSGVLFDYALLFGRPALLAKADADSGGQEGEDLPSPLWDLTAAQSLSAGRVAPGADGLASQAQAALAGAGSGAERLAAFRDENYYNFGAAGPAAAAALEALAGGRPC